MLNFLMKIKSNYYQINLKIVSFLPSELRLKLVELINPLISKKSDNSESKKKQNYKDKDKKRKNKK